MNTSPGAFLFFLYFMTFFLLSQIDSSDREQNEGKHALAIEQRALCNTKISSEKVNRAIKKM